VSGAPGRARLKLTARIALSISLLPDRANGRDRKRRHPDESDDGAGGRRPPDAASNGAAPKNGSRNGARRGSPKESEPDQHPQERIIGAVAFLARYGDSLVPQLIKEAAQECPGHKAIFL